MSEYPLTEKWKQRALDAEKRIAELEHDIAELEQADDEADKMIGDYKYRIERLLHLEQPRWIPVSERLPEESSEVLGVTFFGNMRIYDYFGKSWFSSGRNLDKPTHWMPLPEPPEVE